MAYVVQVPIIHPLFLAITLRWYDNTHISTHRCLDDLLCIVAFVSKQLFCLYTINHRHNPACNLLWQLT